MPSFTHWLSTTIRQDAGLPFHVTDVVEQRPQRQATIPALVSELVEAHVDPSRLQRKVERAGLTALRIHLQNRVFPTKLNVRVGNFGEVVVAAMLRERNGLYIPIYKLRFREKRDWPMRMTDLLAFELGDRREIRAVWYGEVKTRVTSDSNAGREGHVSLAKECGRERPEIISFVVDRLYELQRYEEADMIDDFLSNTSVICPSIHYISLVFDESCWSEQVLMRLRDLPPTLENLRVDVILLSDLKSLINQCYEQAMQVYDAAS